MLPKEGCVTLIFTYYSTLVLLIMLILQHHIFKEQRLSNFEEVFSIAISIAISNTIKNEQYCNIKWRQTIYFC